MRLHGRSEWKRKILRVNKAAEKGRLEDIEFHLAGLSRDTISDILHFNPNERTSALTIAIEKGHVDVVRLLVEKYNVTVNDTIYCERVPLLHTERDCPLEITKILVENGADVNQLDHYRRDTALTRACRFGRLDVVQYLVEKGANIHQEVFFTTALVIASSQNFTDIVRWLVENGAAVNQVVCGATALHIACWNRCLDAVRCLVDCGADVNLASDDGKQTPLLAACNVQSLDTARCLVERGANVNATDWSGCSPLGVCCKNGNIEIMRFLLENGADPSLPDHNGRTPLLHAATNIKMQAVDVLVEVPTLSRQAKIDGLEVLGASLILSSRFEEGHDFIVRAMRERYRDPLQKVEKVPLPPEPTNGDFRESQTLEELTQRRQESTLLIKEALLILERVLGRGTEEVKQAFSRVLAGGTDVPAAWLLRACTANRSPLCLSDVDWLIALSLSGRCAFLILEETLRETIQALSHYENNSWQANYPFALNSLYAGGLAAFQEASRVVQTGEEMQSLEDLLRHFLQLTMVDPKGSSALHMALDMKGNRALRYQTRLNLSCSFINLLLQCKSDLVHAQDEDGNTPLHILFSTQYDDAELPDAQKVAGMLLQAGAHLDARNRRSKTPLQRWYAGQFQEVLRDYTCVPPSLQCCCARVIMDEKVPYHSQVPEKMKKFIMLHGSETQDTKLPRQKPAPGAQGVRRPLQV